MIERPSVVREDVARICRHSRLKKTINEFPKRSSAFPTSSDAVSELFLNIVKDHQTLAAIAAGAKEYNFQGVIRDKVRVGPSDLISDGSTDEFRKFRTLRRSPLLDWKVGAGA